MNLLAVVALSISLIFICLVLVVAMLFLIRRRPLFPPIWVKTLPVFPDQSKLQRLRQLGKEVFEVLNEHNIPYVLICGSLLGAIRHNGEIVPWDDDIDIAVPVSHKDAALKLLLDGVKGSKLAHGDHSSIHRGDVFVDVFFMTPMDGKLKYTIERARVSWPNEWLDADVFTTRVKWGFCGTTVYIPKQYKAYLDRAYPKWDEHACIGWIHNWNIEPLLYSVVTKAIAPICQKLK